MRRGDTTFKRHSFFNTYCYLYIFTCVMLWHTLRRQWGSKAVFIFMAWIGLNWDVAEFVYDMHAVAYIQGSSKIYEEPWWDILTPKSTCPLNLMINLSRDLLPVIQALHAQLAPRMEPIPLVTTALCPHPLVLRSPRHVPLAGTPAHRLTRPPHITARGKARAHLRRPPPHGAAAPAAPRGRPEAHLSPLTSPRTKLSLHQSPPPPQPPECPQFGPRYAAGELQHISTGSCTNHFFYLCIYGCFAVSTVWFHFGQCLTVLGKERLSFFTEGVKEFMRENYL